MELSSIRRCFITYRECNANTNSPTLYSNLHFNQRTRMGCDIDESKTLVYVRCFNPRTRMGCDLQLREKQALQRWFQSTHPHGVRPSLIAERKSVQCFNPRTRMGCDKKKETVTTKVEKFQSTHPHGVRPYTQQ